METCLSCYPQNNSAVLTFPAYRIDGCNIFMDILKGVKITIPTVLHIGFSMIKTWKK